MQPLGILITHHDPTPRATASRDKERQSRQLTAESQDE
jgi:hypothetical protein